MKRVAVAVVGSMLVAAGGAAADEWHGSGWTATADPQVAAKTVQRLHDQLKASYEADDVAGVKSNVRELGSVLDALVTRTDDWATRAETRDLSVKAKDLNSELAGKLAAIPDQSAKELPRFGVLTGLAILVGAVLVALVNVVGVLLGPAPAPVPVPPPGR